MARLGLQATKNIFEIRNIIASSSSDIMDMDSNSDSHIVVNKLKQVNNLPRFYYITSLFPQNSKLMDKTLELDTNLL
jgi:hypothetical protein